MKRGNKPFFRIQKRPDKTWLSVQMIVDGKTKTLHSYGNADNPKNWDDAIEGLLVEIARHYHAVKKEHLEGSNDLFTRHRP
ncbi:hypothetical protein LCGC14_1145560 [marine sediment metagenome]|uniref:Uncharacterized protein n=1 Tax=marine sediment metagenome TaxID=412755 RepID=A0A0F9LX01_9ZZZZ